MTALTRNRVPLTLFHPDAGAGWTTLWTRPDSTDETVIEEIFEADVYRLRNLDLSTRVLPDTGLGTEYAPQTVIDLGANVGVFSATCLQMGVARVVAVEPEPSNVQLLRRNLTPWIEQNQVTILEAAVGPTNGKTTIVGDAGTAHTTPEGHYGFLVNQMTLADVLFYTDGPVAMCKIDVEGGEYAIIEACPSDVLVRIERIHMEFHGERMGPHLAHLGPDDGRYGRLLTKLAKTHAVTGFGDPDIGGQLFAHRYDL